MKTPLMNLLRPGLKDFCVNVPFRYESSLVWIPLSRGGDGLSLLKILTNNRSRWMDRLIRALGLAPDSMFLDIGAHLGETLITMKGIHRRWPYLGFEPNILCASYVRTLIRSNRYPESRVLPVGLSNRARLATLFTEGPTDSGGTIIGELRPGRDFTKHLVPTFCFDEIRDGLISEPVGFVKIDVEGAESEVLSGMTKTLETERPMVLCEVLGPDSKADPRAIAERNQNTMNLVIGLDYHVYQIQKSDTRDIGLRRLRAFSSEVYSVQNQHLWDYLFVPSEIATKALARLRA